MPNAVQHRQLSCSLADGWSVERWRTGLSVQAVRVLGDTVGITVDWDRIDVPSPTGEVVREGDVVGLHPLPGHFEQTAVYGCQDFE